MYASWFISMEAGFFIFMIMVVVGSIIMSTHQSKKLDQTWSNVARQLGLNYQPGSLMQERVLSGTIDGCSLQVQTFTKGSGKNAKKYTRYRVNYPVPLGIQFTITRQGFMSGLTKALGAQDIEIADPHFDQLAMIKGPDPRAVVEFLTPERRIQIAHILADLNDVEIDGVSIQSVYYGRESAEAVLMQKIQRMVEFVRSMVREQESHHPVASPPPLRMDPILPRPQTILSQAPQSGMPPPLPQVDPTPDPETPKTLQKEKLPSPPPHKTADAAEAGQTLFGQRLGLTEIDKIFNAQYKDCLVSGTGLLRSWAQNSYDFVFGTGKFIKVTVEVPLEKNTTNHHHSFQVVIKLPVSDRVIDHGQPYEFHGKLVKADALMRQLYVDSYEEYTRG